MSSPARHYEAGTYFEDPDKAQLNVFRCINMQNLHYGCDYFDTSFPFFHKKGNAHIVMR